MTTPRRMNLRRTLDWEARRIQSVLEATRDVQHMGLAGSVREREVREVLRAHLPGQYDVAHGQIENAQGEKPSRQQDVIVLDRTIAMPFLISRDEGVFPLETIRATIEVKSNTGRQTIDGAVENVASVKRLCSEPKVWTPFGGIICLSGHARPETIIRSYYEKCQKYEQCHRPDALLVLGSCVVVWGGEDAGQMLRIDQPRDSNTQILVTSDDGLLVFLVALIQHLDRQQAKPPHFDLLRYVNRPDFEIKYQLYSSERRPR